MKMTGRILAVTLMAVTAVGPMTVRGELQAVSAELQSQSEGLQAAAAAAYDNIAVSRVTNYVNVRTEPRVGSEIVGKIYNNCAATILSTVDGENGSWYQIQSGTVTGYIKAEYFITGEEAEKIAKEIGTVYVTINAENLRLRKEPSLDSEILTLLSQNDEYVEVGESGEFMEIQVDAGLSGYVHRDYVKERVEFKQAVSLEEEKKQQEEAERLKKEADEAIARMEEIKNSETQTGEIGFIAANPNDTQNGTGTASGQESGQQDSSVSQNGGTSAEQGSNGTQSGASGTQSGASGTQSGSSGTQSGANGTQSGANGTQSGASGSQSGTSSPQAGTGSSQSGNTGTSSGTGSGQPSEAGQTQGPGAESQNNGGPGSSNSSTAQGPGSAELTSATRTAIVAYAKQFIGNPYVYGGTSLTEGADCSGFTMRIYEHFGIDTGRSSRDQAAKGRTISIDEVQPGDLVFYASGNYINHVAMYIGGGQIIHSSTERTGIITSTMNYRTPYKAVTFLD